jgi:K+-transporting ATPase ATPase A chain
MDWELVLAGTTALLLLIYLAGFVLLFGLLLAQGVLPLNPLQGCPASSRCWPSTSPPALTNTNWQAYAGETT